MARTKNSKSGASRRGGGMTSNSTDHGSDHAHAEIWDDSALLRSWDDAIKEYEVSAETPPGEMTEPGLWSRGWTAVGGVGILQIPRFNDPLIATNLNPFRSFY